MATWDAANNPALRGRIEILDEAARRMPHLLIGGYHIDEAILGLYLALKQEGPSKLDDNLDNLTEEEVWQRIRSALNAAWDGLI